MKMASNDTKPIIRNNGEAINDKRVNKCSSDSGNSTKNENLMCKDKNIAVRPTNTGTSQRAKETQKYEKAAHPDTFAGNEKALTPKTCETAGGRENFKHPKDNLSSLVRNSEGSLTLNGIDSEVDAGIKQELLLEENKFSEEILALMETINKMVKSAQFNPILGGHIISLYNYMKKHGGTMEDSHKTELNQVFVSIRQACCRDAGQLGTPCRLKMMELIELRAMKWSPSLSHSQYYLDRSVQYRNNTVFPEKTKRPPITLEEVSEKQERHKTISEKATTISAPVSAPPYGTIPVNPFTFNLHHPPNVSPVLANEMMQAGSPMTPISPAPAPSYFLVQAAHASPGGIAFFPTPTPCILPNAGAPMMHHSQLTARFSTPLSLSTLAAGNLNPLTEYNKNSMVKSANNLARPVKIPGKNQFRDEIVIRNADSGKIMGVKGRRVSIIEELSGSVVSFQKVAQNAKERVLTITGPSEESILHARLLIEDTIRRNVSPDRGVSSGGDSPARLDLEHSSTELGSSTGVNKNSLNSTLINESIPEVDTPQNETECALSEMGSILKLSCSDPAVLKVARQALNEYFNRQETSVSDVSCQSCILQVISNKKHWIVLPSADKLDSNIKLRRSGAGERRTNLTYCSRERRKSMPLPLNKLENLAEANESGSQTPEDSTEHNDGKMTMAQSRLNARSIPNLTGVFDVMDGPNNDASSQGRTKIVYTRDFLLKCSAVCQEMEPPIVSTDITDGIQEVLLSNVKIFDAALYKKKFADFKFQMRA